MSLFKIKSNLSIIFILVKNLNKTYYLVISYKVNKIIIVIIINIL